MPLAVDIWLLLFSLIPPRGRHSRLGIVFLQDNTCFGAKESRENRVLIFNTAFNQAQADSSTRQASFDARYGRIRYCHQTARANNLI